MKETKKPLRGLDGDGVLASRLANGDNRLPKPRRISFFRRILGELGDPIIRVLLVALGVRVLLSFGSVDWLEIGGILLAVAVSSGVSAVSECGSERAFERLQASMAGARALVIRSGREEQGMMTTLVGLIVVMMVIIKEIGNMFTLIKSTFGF